MKSRSPFYIVCIIAVTLSIVNFTANERIRELKTKYSELESQHQDLQYEYASIFDEVIRLEDENGLFTSMFGEIESQPGGSEILKTLFDKHYDDGSR